MPPRVARRVEHAPPLGARARRARALRPRPAGARPLGADARAPSPRAPTRGARARARARRTPPTWSGVVVRRDDGDRPPPLRRQGPRPCDPRALLVVVRRRGLDEEHVAPAQRVAVGVGGRQERRRARGEEREARRELSRPHGASPQRSTTTASASPPPMQSVARPRFVFWSFIAWSERRQDARAARADGVAERDGAAADVDLLEVEADELGAHHRRRPRRPR